MNLSQVLLDDAHADFIGSIEVILTSFPVLSPSIIISHTPPHPTLCSISALLRNTSPTLITARMRNRLLQAQRSACPRRLSSILYRFLLEPAVPFKVLSYFKIFLYFKGTYYNDLRML